MRRPQALVAAVLLRMAWLDALINEPVADFVKLVLKVIKFANGGG